METLTPDPAPPAAPRNRLVLAVLGAAAALAAGVCGAWLLSTGSRSDGAAPPAAGGGLVIDTTAAEDGHVDPAKPLRCFVQGQFVGELVLADCARRNGVATDALDVGLDQMGALAATDPFGADLAPRPMPTEDAPSVIQAPPVGDEMAQDAADASLQACQRHAAGRWRRAPADMDLDTCVQLLFAGRCERQGEADYGRWGQQTLRLVAGRVEISDDNRAFRTLTAQGPNCSVEPVR